MNQISANTLDEFVRIVNVEGGGDIHHPSLSRYYPFQFHYETRIDQGLDPFSDEYFQQQISLYEEISRRKLDQWGGELHPVEMDKLLKSANPLGITNPTNVSEHVRAISAMLSICGLGENAHVLDMGAGHGLSSEIYAFCGCKVHAIDIDPALGELSVRRSAIRNLNIKRSHLNYDDLSPVPSGAYDAAFFFQSLHHCLKPWELIASLKTKLIDGGVIAFTGEPIQTNWWRNWGIRLDEESLYVARSFGWFESGWSKGFIRRCFERNGFNIQFFDGGHGGGEIGVATTGSLESFVRNAERIGHQIAPEQTLRYFTKIGKPCVLQGRTGFGTEPNDPNGYLVFGPYIDLHKGSYEVSFALEKKGAERSSIIFDVTAEAGTRVFYSEKIDSSQMVSRIVEIPVDVTGLEARVLTRGKSGWSCSYPQIRRL